MTASQQNHERFLEGGGDLGELMRTHDWASTPLGPPAGWPQSLKTAVRILLTSQQPFWIGWGPELTYLYNDACKPIVGGKHPDALGRPLRDVWNEIFDVVGPLADHVMTRDEGIYREAELLLTQRHGYREETYTTFSYSPIPLDDGTGPGGLICATTDNTRRVIGERQVATLGELASTLAPARSWREACALTTRMARANPRDLPFLLVYVFEEAGEPPTLVGASHGAEVLADPTYWDFFTPAADRLRIVSVSPNVEGVPTGAWDEPPAKAAVLPLSPPGEMSRPGFVVVGLNPFRAFDEIYRGFLEDFCRHVGVGVANAEASPAVPTPKHPGTREYLDKSLERDFESGGDGFTDEVAELRDTFAQTPIPTAVVSGDDLVFQKANRAFQVLLGSNDIVGASAETTMPHIGGRSFTELVRSVIASGEPESGKEEHVTLRGPNGGVSVAFWSYVLAPLRNSTGEIESVIVICDDVTAQVTARHALKRSEARYREIFESAVVSIWEVDLSLARQLVQQAKTDSDADFAAYWIEHPTFVDDVIASFEVRDVNQYSVAMFGVSSKAELIERLADLGTASSRAFHSAQIEAMWNGEPSLAMETRFQRGDGQPLDVLATVAFDGEPQHSNAMVTLVDISALKRAEAALLESDRRKDEFIAMLGHELRNPLAALRSATELLRRTPDDDQTVDQATRVLDRQSAHMTRLVDGLLEVSRISRGKISLHRIPVDLADVVRTVVADRRREFEKGRIEVVTSVPEGEVWVLGDPVRLTQVFDNLLSNSLKFTETSDSVTVAVNVLGDRVLVSVQDTGVGFRPELTSVIFEPFQQDKQDAARSAGGLGLGLALARGLVQLHDGIVVAHSDGPGRGAKFTVELPLTDARPRPESPERGNIDAGLRILMVEDNIDAAEMLRDILVLQGHDVVLSTTAPTALEILEQQSFDAVLCDIGLPKMDGLEFARRVRKDPVARTLPLIALTGYGQEQDRRNSAEAGFDAHLLKPVNLDLLESTLASLTCESTSKRA